MIGTQTVAIFIITLRKNSSNERYGVGLSVVEVDCLTGDHQVLKSEIIMDLGSSLNPSIDIGQVYL